MADDIHNLVLGPFRDVFSKGNQALENAVKSECDPMAKAAQGLVNNAERALKKMEPVCQKQFNEYQSVFIDALKENDDVSHFREQLHDMVWDLDDALEVDGFDPEIYTKLQALVRTAALKMSDIVVRMKLENPIRLETPITPISERPRTPSIVISPSAGSPMEAKAGPIQGWEEGEETAAARMEDESSSPKAQTLLEQAVPESPTIETPTIQLQRVPSEPREDPWRGPASESLTLQIRSLGTGDAIAQRRPRISPGGQYDGEPVSPLTPDNEAATPPFKHSPSSSRDNIVSPIDEDPRNSFVLPSGMLTSVAVSQEHEAQPSPQTSKIGQERQLDGLASPSSIYSDHDGGAKDTTDDTGSSGKIVVVPDAEGLIPVDGQFDAGVHSPVQKQPSDQHPTVIVIDSYPRSRSGVERPPPPNSPMKEGNSSSRRDYNDAPLPTLNLSPGSRITNVSFRAEYNGEWAVGWDSTSNKKGLFLMDCVKMEMPTGEDANFFRAMGGDKGGFDSGFIGIGIGRRRGRSASASSGIGLNNGGGGLSGLSAVARWKFSGPGGSSSGTTTSSGTSTLKKEKDRTGFSFGSAATGGSNEASLPWLKFEKGEVITGVCFPHPQHWCWAGYNSKNKWGIFPRAFMAPGTLLEEAPSNLLQLLHKEGNVRSHHRQNSTGSGSWIQSLSSPSSPPGSGMATGSASLFSRISSKGLGLRRLSSGPGSSNSNKTENDDWARRPGDVTEPTPESPSGSFYSPGSTGIGSTSTRSPRPSLY
ncbi:hypothetical protein V8F06_008584 [Rhypophila decipiens]